MFSDEVVEEIAKVAAGIGVEAASLLAVADVESGGRAFAWVDGRREPLIRFEGHYFDRRLSGTRREAARLARLSDPKAGGIANPASQGGRWTLLARAAAIDRQAAYESVSWGIGQVMGAHWAWLGHDSVEALAAEARESVAGQTRLMARFIEKAGLTDALRARDWAAFARGYNGPGYRMNSYHLKMAAAWRRYARQPPAGEAGLPPPLRRGSRGPAVAALQTALTRHGFPVPADGAFGRATERAVLAFQGRHGLPADGIAGAMTQARLAATPFLRTGAA